MKKNQKIQILNEPARKLSVPPEQIADVVVCGGGPAGVAAALAASRSGVHTILLEAGGCLGGIWTSGLMSWVIDGHAKSGIMSELKSKLEERGACRYRVPSGQSFACDIEPLKLLLEELVAEAGVDVQYHTRIAAALVSSQIPRKIDAVVSESKSGRQAWMARCFIDATGDGDVAAYAGCGFDFGRSDVPGETQPMSLIALVTGINIKDVESFVGGGLSEPKKRLFAEFQRAGVTPSYAAPTLFAYRDDLFALMANHQYGASALDARSITSATFQGRAELYRLVEALRSLGHPWADLRITATADQIGVREGRRIHALYTVTKADVIDGRSHEDNVCRVTFSFDVHTTRAERAHEGCEQVKGGQAQPYDIPLRSLIAADVDNLLLAGRCIGGDFEAHSSYRVTGNAVELGQAAGVAAAFSVQNDVFPKELPWHKMKSGLESFAKKINIQN
jgi:hypothetical protein